MTRIAPFLLILLTFSTSDDGCRAQDTKPGARQPLTKDQKFLNLVDWFITNRPLELRRVSEATGMQLEVAPGSNDFFTMYDSTGNSSDTLTKVHVRIPTKLSTSKDGIAILTASPDITLTSKEIRARFGERPGISFPSPDQPRGSPFWYTYRYEWGELRIGFTPDKAERLVDVVLDVGQLPEK